MIRWMALLLALPMSAMAQETPVGETKTPPVEDMIPAAVKALADPPLNKFQGGLKMAVTSRDAETQAHVVEGLDHLHGGWEFEAARHFAVAAKRDPDCLLAHWGMAVALLEPNLETQPQRQAALERMITLIEAGQGNELERGYAYGLIQYFKEGPASAGDAFRKLSERYPRDVQAAIFSSLFGRGGYDILGQATPDQESAEKHLEALLDRYPDSTVLLNALLTIRAEAPDLTPSLPLARKLCTLAPGYPPYFHLLGHYEWRTGNHARAAVAFARASSLFADWMKSSKAPAVDCPGWVSSECYRVVALASKGDFATALAIADTLLSKEVPADRASSTGGRLLLWEGKTLKARLLMARGQKGDIAAALAALPSSKSLAAYDKGSLSRWFSDGLRLDLEALRLLEEGKVAEATQVSAAFDRHGEGFAKLQSTASAGGERSSWNRAFKALEVLAAELKGRLALAGPKSGQGSAAIWFRSASGSQTPATMMMPPSILTPMGIRLGDSQMQLGKPAEAVAAYEESLKAFPGNLAALKGLEAAAGKAALPEKVEAARKQIEELSAP